ncbi:MAG: cupredoxin domain-containing protein [Azospirillaceae bacterium]|nr:cupredoxin domain-containing protein [Azospirillaceae bacterium]
MVKLSSRAPVAAIRRTWTVALLLALGLVMAAVVKGHADDLPVFMVEMKDGAISPSRLEVPADTPFRIAITNTGTSPAELENSDMHLEKMVTPGGHAVLVIRRLSAGAYLFFDDFQPGGPGILIVAR